MFEVILDVPEVLLHVLQSDCDDGGGDDVGRDLY